ncbi:GTP-binding protein [Anaerococcus sp. Marseille-P9784]|uniref:GTP-binding protein n=1 Tax=Anaerococcus sp. Marseille-P9784 TaxID=2614127 RepID=UPI00124A4BFE|nr:GTP-binding protein [Anaerococcus sp. Marseille-P9784]
MKIIIVSGFLGSGKTTFIKKLSKKLDNLVILENDYAKANVDKELLKNTGKEIVSLEEGCICCSKQKDFATTVMSIENTINPEYLIIEPTGLGYLSKIIDNISPIEYEKIELLKPISIVDYYSIDKIMEEYRELFLDQIQNSSYILLSKTENISTEKIEKEAKKLEELTKAKVFTIHYNDFDKKEWDSLIGEYDKESLIRGDYKHLHLDNLAYENVVFKDFNELGTNLNAVCQNRFGKLIRAKGLVNVGEKMIKVDVVNGKFNVEKYEGKLSEPTLVFIGKDLDESAYNILFKKD